jgi:mono/diheme cytochrome c family protein
MNRHPRQLGCTSTAARGAGRRSVRMAVPWLVVVLWLVALTFVDPTGGLRPVRAEDAVTDSAEMREFLARHCADCHGDSITAFR